jgi:hypothetical protein
MRLASKIFVVARMRLDRYEKLRHQFEDGPDVRIILDQRKGERRAPHSTFAGVDRRRTERRRLNIGIDSYVNRIGDTGTWVCVWLRQTSSAASDPSPTETRS